jgi:hypothetical protein
MSDQYSQDSSLHTPHSVDNLEYNSPSASPASPPIFEPGFLGILGVPPLARGCAKHVNGELHVI